MLHHLSQSIFIAFRSFPDSRSNFALVIRSGVPATDLKHLPCAYPTSGSDVPYMI
jgi:hypothetical protein